MVAIRFKTPEERAEGFMLLVRHGTVRTLRGPIYIFNDRLLPLLDDHNIPYEKVPLPVKLNEVDTLRDTPTTVL
jgi:hypothetical protein